MAVLLIEFADRREVRRASAVRSSPLCEMTIAMALLGFFFICSCIGYLCHVHGQIYRGTPARDSVTSPPPNLRYI